jgi:transcriptional regulator with AAA-type ATPase domain/polyferredoxin
MPPGILREENMNLPEITSLLAKTGIFSTLPQEDLKRIGELLKPKECARGEVVIHQGDFGDSMYLIFQGEVEVFIRNQEGSESVVACLKEGDFFGEMALLTGSPRSASVRVQKDALFLSMAKTDFDDFLKDHPHLAILFSKILVDRIKTTNTLYVHELNREGQLAKLLFQEKEERLTRLIGKTKQFQNIGKKVEELAENDEPVMIVGPEGVAADDVARLIHLANHRHDRPFMIIDLRGGDEWRAYRSRVKSFSQDKEEQCFEQFQISCIFGHERGSMAGTEASRLGFLELADRGTVVLKNIDFLAAGTREKLISYLLQKKFCSLGADDSKTADTRVIATLSSYTTDGEIEKSLRGKVPEVLWKNRIDLPSLTSRRRDIPVIAEALLEKHTALTGKVIKGISPEAINTLVRYSWPGNDQELESVIARGVLVCDGETLSAEHIFLGLTPYSEKGHINLLRFRPFRQFFENLKLRTYFRSATLVGMIGVVLITFMGATASSKNLGMGLIWYYWWPFLLLSLVVISRFYCSICPIYGLFQLSRKLGSLERPAPRFFNHIGFAMAAVFALGLFWAEYFFGVKETPIRTTLLLGTIASSAVAFNFIFQSEVWCRYICPLGSFIGVFSCLAPVELRANNNVCSSQCRTTACYKGDGKQSGCPMKLFPVSLMSNQFCKMCGTCVHNCPYNSVHLDLRWPGAEIWKNKEPSPIASLSILAFLGIVFPLSLHERLQSEGQLYFTLAYFTSVLGAIAAFMAASLTAGLPNFKKQIRAYGFAYLPLAFAGHLTFLLPYLVGGLSWMMGFSLSGEFHHQVTSPWPQRLIIMGGIIWSWWAIRRLSGKRPLIVPLVHGALVLIFGLALILAVGV